MNDKWVKGRSDLLSKGDALKILEPLIHEAIEYGLEGESLMQRFEAGKISKFTVETELAIRWGKVQGIYQKFGDLPFLPAALHDYGQACQVLFADIDNIYLPFTELGKKTWSTFDQRIQLSKSYIGAFRKDLERRNFEREKIY